MKRDMDLIRELLFWIERKPDHAVRKPHEIDIDGYSSDEIGYHLSRMYEAGLISGEVLRSTSTADRIIQVWPFDLSWAGHEFADSVRDPEIWAKTKAGVQEAGGFSLDLMKALAKGFLKGSWSSIRGWKLISKATHLLYDFAANAEGHGVNQLIRLGNGPQFPEIIGRLPDVGRMRFLEFFTANIRNPNTRKAYARSAGDFLRWCETRGVTALPAIQPLHVAAWIEELGRSHAVPTVKLRLAAVRHLFDWMVTGQIMPTNPAHAVRGPSYSTKKGKTPVLSPQEARQLLDSIPADTIVGQRDRALIGLMTYSFARIGAAIGMEVRDVYVQNRRLWVRLHEKGGKLHEMPCHHSLEEYLDAYMEAGGLKDQPRSPLFRTIGRGTGILSETPCPRPMPMR